MMVAADFHLGLFWGSYSVGSYSYLFTVQFWFLKINFKQI